VVGAASVRELKRRIHELERVLDKKTLENEIRKEADAVAHEKTLMSQLPSLPDEKSQ